MSDSSKKKWRSFKRKRKSENPIETFRTNKLDDLTNDLSTSLNQEENFNDSTLNSKPSSHSNPFEIENCSLSSDDLVSQ
jgi:hypothetical protein